MANKKRKIKKEERVIYLLLSPDKRKFYINHCVKGSLQETYRHNLKGRRESSKAFIDELYPKRPCLLILETAFCTTYEATNLQIIWIKIFLDHGFKCYNHPDFIDMANDLYFDSRHRFAERNNLEIQKIIGCENCQMPIFNRTACQYFTGKLL